MKYDASWLLVINGEILISFDRLLNNLAPSRNYVLLFTPGIPKGRKIRGGRVNDHTIGTLHLQNDRELVLSLSNVSYRRFRKITREIGFYQDGKNKLVFRRFKVQKEK